MKKQRLLAIEEMVFGSSGVADNSVLVEVTKELRRVRDIAEHAIEVIHDEFCGRDKHRGPCQKLTEELEQ